MAKSELRVAVLGFGAIGAKVASELAAGGVADAKLEGVIVRSAGGAAELGFRELTLAQALDSCDLIVECAGVEAAKQHGAQVLTAGRDFLIVSIGVMADQQTRLELLETGPGRLFLSTGAIGGLDILSAAARNGGLERASLTTGKLPATLVQKWMTNHEANKLREAERAVTVFEGSVTDAIKLFPKSLNVGVALACATNLWQETRVRLIADPEATLTTHEISAAGRSGEYDFTITNLPDPANPATSAIVAEATLNGIARLAKPGGSFL